jgi:hypothetical protein
MSQFWFAEDQEESGYVSMRKLGCYIQKIAQCNY